ncbi:MAG: DUF1579 domain-containing protein [Planctomycetota bacterium]|nr:MAG: DUF1579 domain-containing protein [Planctomycetota bacterium]
MKYATRLLLAAVLLAGAPFAFQALRAQEPQEPSADEMTAMMAEMQKLAAPGEMHKLLARMEGEWKLAFEMNMPGAPPMKSTGSSTVRMVLGGRYLQEELKGSFMGMPFEGLNLIGYDNFRKEFHSTWFDTSSTWKTTAVGSYDPATKTLEFHGTMRDIADMEGRPYRMTTTEIDADHFVSEMYDTIPPQGEVKVMTIRYERAG